MTNSYQAVFVMPFLHFNPPDSGKDAHENSLALLYRPVSVISEIWLPPNFTSKEITIMKFRYDDEKRRFEAAWEKITGVKQGG